MRSLRFALALLVFLSLAACGRLPTRTAWTMADLRALDPLDSRSASAEILAVYTRTSGSDLEIRIDLLDLPLEPDYTLELRLTADEGQWSLRLPAVGPPELSPAGEGQVVRVVRDPWLDTVTVRMNRLFFPSSFLLEVASFTAGDETPADHLGPVGSSSRLESRQAPVVVAFRDAFPSATPAQALRRWDGAHTGPTGERHGLKHVLTAAVRYDLPVVLLDLLTPASLAGLDQLGVTGQLRSMLAGDLLVLPEVAYSQPADLALEFSRQAAAGFGLPSSQFAFSVGDTLLAGYRAQFLVLPDPSHLARSGSTRLIPLPGGDALQATDQGPTLEVRRELVEIALTEDPGDLVVLGGSLPSSTWGDSDMAGPTFAWLAEHPWVHVLNGFDLLTFPASNPFEVPQAETTPTAEVTFTASGVPSGLDSLELRALLESYLGEGPADPVQTLAGLATLNLAAPTEDPLLANLRSQYLWQVRLLLLAKTWSWDSPSRADCFRFRDEGVRTACALSTRDYFAILEPEGARLLYLFYRSADEVHQLVGPTSQFAVGLSDPSGWQPWLGEAADPAVVPGAFVDDTRTWEVYAFETDERQIIFTSPDGGRQKTFELTEAGLLVTYRDMARVRTTLVLAVDPQAFFLGPASYQAALTPRRWTWGLAQGVKAEVSTLAELSAQGFTSAWPFLALPEDPDLAYPLGHTLPFPLSLVTIAGVGTFQVRITAR